DSLQNIAMENVARRTAEIKDAEHIIREELAKIEKEMSESEANAIIRDLSLKFTSIKDRELSMARTRLKSADPESVIEDLTRSLVNNLTSELYMNMRKASREGDWETCAAVRRLFGLEDR
ncbi:MAG: glutamyl-tRNA reductase, partial [Candidatus Methanomethylophilaceae archaeon]|nr:glutamyl-tRNA reductase [Candidatus Methanomethylophilaceae archaeon]